MMPKLFRKRSTSKSNPVDLDTELSQRYPDATPFERELISATRTTTMTSPERLIALIRAIDHLERNRIAGDIVECGVWRGGSMYAAAKTLLKTSNVRRKLWLYDTFEGMPPPTKHDVDFRGNEADALLASDHRDDPQGVWCVSGLTEVQQHLEASGYPAEQIEYVVGPVEETLPRRTPDRIALLRLDTDWYRSTRCEMDILYPRLVSGGILIVDDYGHWQGCREAIDEYVAEHGLCLFFSRIDYTGRIAVKP